MSFSMSARRAFTFLAPRSTSAAGLYSSSSSSSSSSSALFNVQQQQQAIGNANSSRAFSALTPTRPNAIAAAKHDVFNPHELADVKLYVGNLSHDTNEDSVRDLFSKYGSISDFFLGKSASKEKNTSYAFVIMPAADAEKAMTECAGAEIDGREIFVEESRPRNEFRGRSSADSAETLAVRKFASNGGNPNFGFPEDLHFADPSKFRYKTNMYQRYALAPHIHPAEFKVGLKVFLRDLGLSKAEEAVLIELMGPQYHPGKKEIALNCSKFQSRVENSKYLTHLLETLIEESKLFIAKEERAAMLASEGLTPAKLPLKLVLTGLEQSTTVEEITELFDNAFTIEKIHLFDPPRPYGYAYITGDPAADDEYNKNEKVNAAIKKWSELNKYEDISIKEVDETMIPLEVSNLNPLITLPKIHSLFALYGKVGEIKFKNHEPWSGGTRAVVYVDENIVDTIIEAYAFKNGAGENRSEGRYLDINRATVSNSAAIKKFLGTRGDRQLGQN
jgi:hypothetical protein